MSNPSPYKGYFCPAPWESVVLKEGGDVQLCSCTAWIPHPVGNLKTQAWEDIWNGEMAQRIRAAILDGSFRYCDANVCPHLNGAKGLVRKTESVTNPKHRKIIDQQSVKAEQGPTFAQISYDPTCNLTCPSCRCGRIVARGELFDEVQTIHDKVVEDVLPSLERVDLSGQGEVFASRVYLPILRNFSRDRFPKLRFWLTTNATLLNEKMWETIRNSHESIHAIHVSINSATRDTFLVNQEGGDWERFLENMAFIGSLRERRIIRELTFGYYVQQNNFREMREIVPLAHRFHVDMVYFANMTNWGTFSDEEFRRRAVHLPEHPEHETFKAALLDPVLADPCVRLGNLQRFLPEERRLAATAADDSLSLRSLDEMTDALGLDDAARDRIKRSIDAAKDSFLKIVRLEPADGGPSPFAYLAGAMGAHMAERQGHVPEGPVAEQCFAEFLRRIATQSAACNNETFTALAAAINRACWDEVIAAVPQEAGDRLRRISTIDWISLETGYDPLGAAVYAAASGKPPKAKPTPPGQSDTEAEATVAAGANAFKDAVAAICSEDAAEGRPAPIDYLADLAADGRKDAMARFLAYLKATRCAATGETYHNRVQQAERDARKKIQAALPPEVWARVSAGLPASLLQVPTGRDPLAQKLREASRRRVTPR